MKKLGLLWGIVLFTIQLIAQNNYLPTIKTYTTKDGLSSDIVHAIHKDDRGFIWIGTEYGLNRFDGQNFDFYSKDNQAKMTIDAVHKIAGDNNGYLWILKSRDKYNYDYTNPTLNIFDTYSSKAVALADYFKDEFPFNPKQIKLLQQLDDNTIFVQAADKAFTYTRKGGFKSFQYPQKQFFIIREVTQLPNNEYLISGFDKEQDFYCYKISSTGKTLQTINQGLSLDFANSNLSASMIKLWTLSTYPFLQNKLTTVPQNQKNIAPVQAKFNKQEKLLWLINENNIYALNSDDEVIYQLSHQNDEEEFKPFPIFFDGENTWLSTQTGGIQIITLQANHFKSTVPFQSPISNSMRGILKAKNGSLWYSSIHAIAKKDELSSPSILMQEKWFTPLLEDRNGNIWWIKANTLKKYESETKTVQTYLSPIPTGFPWSMYETVNGEIWYGTNLRQVIAFNPKTEQFREVIKLPVKKHPDCNIYAIQPSKNDLKTFWLCTNQGLWLCHENGKVLARYHDKQEEKYYLPAYDFHHMHQDNQGTIWLATGDGGLLECRISSDEYRISKYKQFTISSGLSSNALHAVYEDDYSYLWLSSDNGLMQFDKETEQIRKYFKKNGTVENEFNRISHFQATDGELFFGTVNGWTSFYPADYSNTRTYSKAPNLTIKSFSQFSDSKSELEDLTAKVLIDKTITLQSGDRFFNIELALLDLNYGKNSTFKYRIKGVYDWQTSKNPILNFSGLPYGTHTLEITAQNGNGQLAANSLILKVRVLRPFYLRWWFVLSVLSALGFGVFYFIKWRTQQLLVNQETEQLKNLDKLKTRFFANISHELRTPIMLILAPLNQIIKQGKIPTEEKTKLQKVYGNSKKLLTLVNEILDLSKLDANKLELNTEPTIIPAFFERLVAQFDSAANYKQIDYQFATTFAENITIQLDQNKMEKVLNNLLSNAIKFTPKNGKIQTIITQNNQEIWIQVKDTGRGIHQDDIQYVFDRYYQSKTNTALEGGTGIALALTKELIELMNGTITVQSELGQGTTFEIKLPYEIVETPALLKFETLVKLNEAPTTNLTGFENLSGLTTEKLTDKKDTILLVEDNRALQEFIQSILLPYYNVVITNNGKEALSQLPTADCQLILSDVMMPEMDGFTFLQKVKADDNFCSIPFILLTARADMQDKLHGLRIGVDDYITKPFEVEELLLRIKNLLTNAQNRQFLEDNLAQEVEEQTAELTTKEKQSSSKEQKSVQPSAADLIWLEQAETIIKRELLNKQYNIEALAHELFISKRQLARRVKQITGLTPSSYIRSIRLQKARTILETEQNYTVSEVSFAVGFENVSHFSKLYKAAFGKHPQEYL